MCSFLHLVFLHLHVSLCSSVCSLLLISFVFLGIAACSGKSEDHNLDFTCSITSPPLGALVKTLGLGLFTIAKPAGTSNILYWLCGFHHHLPYCINQSWSSTLSLVGMRYIVMVLDPSRLCFPLSFCPVLLGEWEHNSFRYLKQGGSFHSDQVLFPHISCSLTGRQLCMSARPPFGSLFLFRAIL